MRVHTYVITTNAGSAPNYDPPFVTLAVCKPRIRKKAKIGELVLAFAGKPVNPAEPHSVVWAGIVSEKIGFADYWHDRRFAGKKPDRSEHSDNFYRPINGQLHWVQNDTHGPEEARKDKGGLFVLGFFPSWKFGAIGPVMPIEFGLRLGRGRRGERMTELTEPAWKRLKAWLDRNDVETVSPSQSPQRCSPIQRRSSGMPVERRRAKC